MTPGERAELQESWLRDLHSLRADLVASEEEGARKLLAAVIHERREVAGAIGALVLRIEASEVAAAEFRTEQRTFNRVALRYLEAAFVVPGPAVSPSSENVVEDSAEGRNQ